MFYLLKKKIAMPFFTHVSCFSLSVYGLPGSSYLKGSGPKDGYVVGLRRFLVNQYFAILVSQPFTSIPLTLVKAPLMPNHYFLTNEL